MHDLPAVEKLFSSVGPVEHGYPHCSTWVCPPEPTQRLAILESSRHRVQNDGRFKKLLEYSIHFSNGFKTTWRVTSSGLTHTNRLNLHMSYTSALQLQSVHYWLLGTWWSCTLSMPYLFSVWPILVGTIGLVDTWGGGPCHQKSKRVLFAWRRCCWRRYFCSKFKKSPFQNNRTNKNKNQITWWCQGNRRVVPYNRLVMIFSWKCFFFKHCGARFTRQTVLSDQHLCE